MTKPFLEGATLPEDRSEQHQEEATTLMEQARARKAFLMTLVTYPEQADDPGTRMAVAELRVDRHWQELQRWNAQREARRFFRRWMSARIRRVERQTNGWEPSDPHTESR